MTLRITIVSIVAFTFLLACGGKNEATDESQITVIELSGNDQMQYNLQKIEVSAGSTVRVNLTHIGQMAENIMGHNFVLLKANTDIAEFASAAIIAKETGYIPEARKEEIIAYTEMIGGGESTFVEFSAPAAGTYKFICTFPGHYGTMQGDFIVK